MVADSLRRLGRLADLPDIDPGPDLATTGFRTTIRAAVVDGRAGLRHRRSHDVVTVASCEVAHPVVEGMLVNGRYGDADEVFGNPQHEYTRTLLAAIPQPDPTRR